MNGFRQQAQGGRKERLKQLDTRLANVEMASRISQMMTQQLMQNMKNMQEDLGKAFGIVNELQYKILAIQEALNLNVEQLNEIAATKRLKDFNEASDREDKEQGFTIGEKVEAQSTVIMTSKTDEVDRGIFRSRLELAKCGVPDLINAFAGREVGAKAVVKLNGVDHEVELLGIRNPPARAEAGAGEQVGSHDVASGDGANELAATPISAEDSGLGESVANA